MSNLDMWKCDIWNCVYNDFLGLKTEMYTYKLTHMYANLVVQQLANKNVEICKRVLSLPTLILTRNNAKKYLAYQYVY